MINLSFEHFFIFASALLFPPVLFIVVTISILATFEKSFGLEEKYIGLLIKVFEVSASIFFFYQFKIFVAVDFIFPYYWCNIPIPQLCNSEVLGKFKPFFVRFFFQNSLFFFFLHLTL